jgi:hypothetical protein
VNTIITFQSYFVHSIIPSSRYCSEVVTFELSPRRSLYTYRYVCKLQTADVECRGCWQVCKIWDSFVLSVRSACCPLALEAPRLHLSGLCLARVLFVDFFYCCRHDYDYHISISTVCSSCWELVKGTTCIAPQACVVYSVHSFIIRRMQCSAEILRPWTNCVPLLNIIARHCICFWICFLLGQIKWFLVKKRFLTCTGLCWG